MLSRVLLFICLLFCQSAWTLTQNDTQAILIESDAAERNEKTGFTQYFGNVLIRQGSLIINANRVELFYQGSDVNRILSHGNPATFQQNNLSGQILAHAETIERLTGFAFLGDSTDDYDKARPCHMSGNPTIRRVLLAKTY